MQHGRPGVDQLPFVRQQVVHAAGIGPQQLLQLRLEEPVRRGVVAGLPILKRLVAAVPVLHPPLKHFLEELLGARIVQLRGQLILQTLDVGAGRFHVPAQARIVDLSGGDGADRVQGDGAAPFGDDALDRQALADD